MWWKIEYYGSDDQWHTDCYVRADSERAAVDVYNENLSEGQPAIMRDNPGWCSRVGGRPGRTSYRLEPCDQPVNVFGEPFVDTDCVMV